MKDTPVNRIALNLWAEKKLPNFTLGPIRFAVWVALWTLIWGQRAWIASKYICWLIPRAFFRGFGGGWRLRLAVEPQVGASAKGGN